MRPSFDWKLIIVILLFFCRRVSRTTACPSHYNLSQLTKFVICDDDNGHGKTLCIMVSPSANERRPSIAPVNAIVRPRFVAYKGVSATEKMDSKAPRNEMIPAETRIESRPPSLSDLLHNRSRFCRSQNFTHFPFYPFFKLNHSNLEHFQTFFFPNLSYPQKKVFK